MESIGTLEFERCSEESVGSGTRPDRASTHSTLNATPSPVFILLRDHSSSFYPVWALPRAAA